VTGCAGAAACWNLARPFLIHSGPTAIGPPPATPYGGLSSKRRGRATCKFQGVGLWTHLTQRRRWPCSRSSRRLHSCARSRPPKPRKNGRPASAMRSGCAGRRFPIAMMCFTACWTTGPGSIRIAAPSWINSGARIASGERRAIGRSPKIDLKPSLGGQTTAAGRRRDPASARFASFGGFKSAEARSAKAESGDPYAVPYRSTAEYGSRLALAEPAIGPRGACHRAALLADPLARLAGTTAPSSND
jgi:hypothetical protein